MTASEVDAHSADDRDLHNTPGPTYQDLLDQDRYPVPAILRERAPWDSTLPRELPRSVYLDQAVHDREVTGLWMRVWQMVCRAEHLAQVGDSVLYEIADRQYIVVRSDEHTIKAFPNSCLHRGRKLRDCDGSIRALRCPFHGFTWGIDGELRNVPTEWDFGHVDKARLRMPEAKVDTWGGFVFINPDPEATPLAEFMGGFQRHFDRFPPDDWYTKIHAAKLLNCNWKVAVEAFIEASHVFGTHPQSLPGTDPCNSQYDIWEHYVRIITPIGLPSGLLPKGRGQRDEQRVMNAMMGRTSSDSAIVRVPEGATARLTFADLQRKLLTKAGIDVEPFCDSEMVDLQTYWMFPNFLLLGGARGLYARFRPYGTDPNQSVMEMAILKPPLPDGNPAPAKMQWLKEDEVWSDLPELQDYALFDQDLDNLSRLQQGLRNNPARPVMLSGYQEAPLGHFHRQLFDTWLGDQ